MLISHFIEEMELCGRPFQNVCLLGSFGSFRSFRSIRSFRSFGSIGSFGSFQRRICAPEGDNYCWVVGFLVFFFLFALNCLHH